MLNRDIGGPIGRTVTDVAKLFTAMTDFSMFPEGYDPRDPVTAFRLNYTHPTNYTQFLNANGLMVCLPAMYLVIYATHSSAPPCSLSSCCLVTCEGHLQSLHFACGKSCCMFCVPNSVQYLSLGWVNEQAIG